MATEEKTEEGMMIMDGPMAESEDEDGLVAEKKRRSRDKEKANSQVNVNCPVCFEPLKEVAEKLPYSHRLNSCIVDRIDHCILDEANPVMVLPNGNAYGQKVLFGSCQLWPSPDALLSRYKPWPKPTTATLSIREQVKSFAWIASKRPLYYRLVCTYRVCRVGPLVLPRWRQPLLEFQKIRDHQPVHPLASRLRCNRHPSRAFESKVF